MLGVSGLRMATSCGASSPGARGAQTGPSNWPGGASLRSRESDSQASRAQRSSFDTHSSLKPKGGGNSSARLPSEAGAASCDRESEKVFRTEAATSSGHFPARSGQSRSVEACLSSAVRYALRSRFWISRAARTWPSQTSGPGSISSRCVPPSTNIL